MRKIVQPFIISGMRLKQSLLFIASLFILCPADAIEYNGRHGWPEQKPPRKLIVCQQGKNAAGAMLLESLSGLAAQAVNEGRFDEMVWIEQNNKAYQRIYEASVKTLGIQTVTPMSIWQLTDYLKKKKIIKGYVLYRLETSKMSAPITDYSSNVATVYASLLTGVLIDESLKTTAIAHGLKELKDARQESLETCFEKNKRKLNNHSVLSIHPLVSNMRDYAIAHKLMLYADKKELIEKVLEWVVPLSPVLGWGCGDEYDFTSLISEWGHYNTASDWCRNLPFISSATAHVAIRKAKEISPSEIQFNDSVSAHSFVMSDGDNMQWTMGNFRDNNAYMANKGIHDTGLSWTLCPTNLSIISPFTWNELADIQTSNLSYIEYGGGYQYPDLFAAKRKNRKELLTTFARRINYHLQQTNIKIFGFICRDVSSEASQEAFQIYAQELEGITGMLAVQYFPYELGGQIYWKKDRHGIDIPIVTATYALWDEANSKRPNCGPPEYIASLINRNVSLSKAEKSNELSWTIVHAWSNFAKSSKNTPLPAIGLNPVKATEQLLYDEIKTVSTNELLWRIRMKYREQQTKAVLNENFYSLN